LVAITNPVGSGESALAIKVSLTSGPQEWAVSMKSTPFLYDPPQQDHRCGLVARRAPDAAAGDAHRTIAETKHRRPAVQL
jgi:hypothetical protein